METGGEQEVAVRSEKRQESGGVSIGNRGGREHRGSSIPLRSRHLRFLFRSYRRFLCLRASPCTSLIHTISRSAWCSSAYLHASSVSELSSPSPTAFPRPPCQRPRSSLVHRPSSVLHKDQSIKNAALHEINPVAFPPPPSSFRSFLRVLLASCLPFSHLLFLFLLLLLFSYIGGLFLLDFANSRLESSARERERGKERKRERERDRQHSSNYRGRDTILRRSRSVGYSREKIVEPATTFVFQRTRSRSVRRLGNYLLHAGVITWDSSMPLRIRLPAPDRDIPSVCCAIKLFFMRARNVRPM